MKLLIVTQAVDSEDPVLGFFVRWIEEFAKHTERIEVICLKEGKHNFYSAKNAVPRSENSGEFSGTGVRVHSLGKEHSQYRAENTSIYRSVFRRVRYAWRFISLVWRLRRDYDAVFVHMNQEYILLGGLFWRLWNKRIALWYTHKSVNLKLRIAVMLTEVIFTASKESFRLTSGKVRVMGHGIDTDFFSPDPSVARGDWLLSVGRLMPSKRHDLAIRAAVQEGRELHIAGEGPERERLETLARELGARVRFLGGISQVRLRDEYRTAASLIHTSETGSLDKVVLEAAACECPVDSSDPAITVLPLSRKYVRSCHSLTTLIPRIMDVIQLTKESEV